MTEMFMTILAASWSVFGEMAPYLLLGFFVAGVLSVMISPEWVERHLGGKSFGQVFKASLFGVPLPLCSCGVLPVAASLRRHGAGKGATTAFLLSTPQTGVDSIAVTYALLGPFLAVFRPVAALITGFIGGGAVQLFDADGDDATAPAPGSSVAGAETAACCNDESACDDSGAERSWLKALRYGFITLPRDIGKALFVGVIISGVISAVVEPDMLKAYLGGGVWPLLVAMAIGVPLYVCATASTPIALGLIHAGLSPGAAIAFLISGPATNGAALATLWKVLGRRTAVIYLITVAVAAVGSGLAVDAVLGMDGIPMAAMGLPAAAGDASDHGAHQHGADAEGLGGWLQNGAAVILLIVLAGALWPRRPAEDIAEEDASSVAADRLDIQVKGMRCNGCVTSLTRALSECGGVDDVTVDLDQGRAVVTGLEVDRRQVAEAIASLGFEVGAPGFLDP